MAEKLKLMCVFAHPDDETFGTGGILAKYAAEGIDTILVSATRGQRGWIGNPEDFPGLEEMGKIREGELRCAAKALGVKELILLDYMDGELDKVEPQNIVSQIADLICKMRPDVMITFGPFGVTGHPDHIAISQFTLAAITAAASPALGGEASLPPHTVSKLYFQAETEQSIDAAQTVMGEMKLPVDGEDRRAFGWPSWAVSAEIDITQYWDHVVQAVKCHKSQVKDPTAYASMPQRFDSLVWANCTFYRVFSLVNSGRAKETDLFTGLRPLPVHVELG